MIGIVRHEMKWYSRNNRRLWCFKEAQVEAVKVETTQANTHVRRGLTTQTDGWTDFLPTSAAQGLCQRVREPKMSGQAQIVQPQMCRERERAFTAAASEEIINCYFCHIGSRVRNGTRVQLWLRKLHPRVSPCTSQSECDTSAQQRVPHIMLVFIITA